VEIMEKLVYSIQEAANLLGISRSYAYELVRNGTIPALELGKKRVIPKEKFIEWINGKSDGKEELH
jgi:excisionase family DNA binding protein